MRIDLVVVLLSLCIVSSFLGGCATYTPPPTDAALTGDPYLASKIMNALEQDPVVGRYTFGVTAANGMITVQGSVPDEQTRTRVLGIIRGTEGVQGVVDKLYRW